jgi:two-component system, OmpR family, sensor histidine kinase KdpD
MTLPIPDAAETIGASDPAAGPRGVWRYVIAVLVVGLASVVSGFLFHRFDPRNLAMVYLLGIAFVATRIGRGPSILASLLSVVSFEFFFMPPYFVWSTEDSQYIFTFAVLLVVALLISGLASRAREQTEQARQRGRRTQILYAMTRELAGLSRPEEIADHAARNLSAVFGARASLTLQAPEPSSSPEPREDAAPGVLKLPLVGSRGTMGVATLHLESGLPLAMESRDLLDSLVRQIAISLERALLAAQAERAEVEVERERLRSALLSSVSHDLRTPLSVIHGAASSLIGEHGLSAEARDELGTTIYEESDRLNRLLGNLLDMTRVQSGDLKVAKEPHALEETVGSAVRRLRHVLRDHVVQPALASDLPLVPLDALLIEQVLVNLLENAARYTPKGARIDVRAGHDDTSVTVEVADAGPGLPSLGAGSRMERFDRTRNGGGLGLAICQAIVVAHGGRMWAVNRAEGGATLRFTLPLASDGASVSPPSLQAHGAR